MNALKILYSTFLLTMINTSAFADDSLQKMVGTLSVKPAPVFAGGKLSACSLEFTAVARDYKYKQGELVYLSGSLGFQADGKSRSLGIYLKIVLNDWDPIALKFIPGDPNSALIVIGNRTSKDAQILSTLSDTPGGYFSVFRSDGSLDDVLKSIEKNELTISYSRKMGSADVPISLDLTVVDTDEAGERKKNVKNTSEFLKCSLQLLNLAKNESSKK